MRDIHTEQIVQAVDEAVTKANLFLPPDITQAYQLALEKESNPRARHFLEIAMENADLAKKECMALCQDTGVVNVEVEIGQEVHIVGGAIEDAINEGVRIGYKKGYFRNSVVGHPLKRINTSDNTPAIVNYKIVPGDVLKMTIFPKGAGSENMGRVAMLKPSQGVEGVKEFVLTAVREASANPCPPIVVGVGIGGSMERAASIAKKALFRDVSVRNSDPEIAELEIELLEKVNQMNIGPQGLGGDTTALGVNIEIYATHIACLPVAVNIGCNCTRRYTVEL
jgi:fumarate hydratase subunit alpha